MNRREFLSTAIAIPASASLATIPLATLPEPSYQIPCKGKMITVTPEEYARHMARLHRLTSPEGKAYVQVAANCVERPIWMR